MFYSTFKDINLLNNLGIDLVSMTITLLITLFDISMRCFKPLLLV